MTVGARVAVLLRGLPRPPRGDALLALTLPVALDAERLAAHPDARAVWDARRAGRLEPELVVAFGEAAAVEAAGAARFVELERRARALFARVIAEGDAAPRLWGALAFAPGALGPFEGFGEARFFLPRWTVTRRGAATTLGLVATPRDLDDPAAVARELAALLGDRAAAPPRPRPRAGAPRLQPEAGDFRGAVARALDAIRAGRLTKVVLARTVEVAQPASAVEALAALAGAAGCVRFLLRSPARAAPAAFVGATPEVLVRVDARGAESEAVAGTEPRRGQDVAEIARLLGREKDRLEHRVVVEGITAALRAAGADPAPTGAPTVRSLARVHHLVTPVTARIADGTHVLALASALHPTPALGGTPREAAVRFAATAEALPRGLYSGPLGWFDAGGRGELVVAIRAALVAPDLALAFAGAGIVEGSVPDVELAETEAKLAAMLHALGVPDGARAAASPPELRPW